MSTAPRVALFTDSYYEANGVARTANALESYAMDRALPLLVVHGGRATQIVQRGSVVRQELRRSDTASFPLEHDLRFDPMLWRHAGRVARTLRAFQPDVVHFTGPSDVGLLAAYLGRRMGLPIVGSWHTNLHEYASRRLLKQFAWGQDETRLRIRYGVERQTLALTLGFYRIPGVLLAPNDDWARLLERRTGTPTFLMTRGVDTHAFTPARRTRDDAAVNIGYVGRLSPEKNVRALAALERAILAQGNQDVRFTIVGDGSERAWLEQTMTRATFAGTLRGDALAEAYANMDVFAFPSETETVGNVVLEAMASGVPVVAMQRGGHRFIVDRGAAVLAGDEAEFIAMARGLTNDHGRRQGMGRAARQAALDRSWDRVFDGVYRAYTVARTRARLGAQTGEALVRVAEKQPSA